MIQDTFGRIDWLKRHLGDVPVLILHMREQAVPTMQGSFEPRVSGTKERTMAPLRIEPLDDADDLWGRTCSLAIDYAQRSGSWRGLPDSIDRQWLIPTSAEFAVVGFATGNHERIYLDVISITRYLIDHAFTLATNREYTTPVDELAESITSARRRYPDAPQYHGARHRCPRCGQHDVVADYSEQGELEALRCEACGSKKVL